MMRELIKIAGLAVLVACSSTTSPEDILITAELGEEPLPSGSETEIMIRVTNSGDGEVRIDKPCRDLGYVVVDSQGEPVASSSEECAQQLETLFPGEDIAVFHRWAAIEGYGLVGGSGAPLPPGVYTLIPVVRLEGQTVEGHGVSFMIT